MRRYTWINVRLVRSEEGRDEIMGPEIIRGEGWEEGEMEKARKFTKRWADEKKVGRVELQATT